MPTKIRLYSLVILLSCINLKGFSQYLIPKDLPTNDKILYYLIENKECREVVKSKDNTIDSLELLDSRRIKAIEIANISLKSAIRINKANRDSLVKFKDSLGVLKASLNNQKLKTKRNRKGAIFLGFTAFLEASFIYFGFFYAR